MKIKLLSIFIFILSVSGVTKAQFKVDGYSINPKLGAYNWVGENVGLAQGCEINIISKKNIFSLDYYNCGVILDFPTINQIDFMVGRYIGDKSLRFQFQGGLGTSWGVTKGEQIGNGIPFRYEKEKFFTVGIPLKLGFKIMPASFISIGADLQANLNFEYPIYMALVSIEIGKIRDKKNVP